MPLSQEVSSWQEAVLTVIMLSANLLESHTIALLWVLSKDRGWQRLTEPIRRAAGGAVLPSPLTEHVLQAALMVPALGQHPVPLLSSLTTPSVRHSLAHPAPAGKKSL